MHHVVRFPRVATTPPPAPHHVGQPLQRGEMCLLRRPDSFFDLKVELRGIDRDLAVVFFRGLDRSETVPVAWLRRA
jgi:hypothetical protein